MPRYVVVTFAAVEAPSEAAARTMATRAAQALRFAAAQREGAIVGAVHASAIEGELSDVLAGLRALAEPVTDG